MRVERWDPAAMDQVFEDVTLDRLEEAAEAVAEAARARCPVGTVTRPMYRRGPFAGQSWTARDAGQLKKSIRVTRKKTKGGKAFAKGKAIRVYAGHYLAYYARIVEHSRPFMRPALAASLQKIKSIVGAK